MIVLPSSRLDLVLLAVAQPVEVVDRRQHRDVAERRAGLQEVAGRAGEQQLVERRAAGPRAAVGQGRRLLGGELAGRRLPAAALERLGAERLRPAAGRVAELAAEEADDRVGDVELRRVLGELGRVGAEPDQRQRQVADHLGGRRHLDDVAEDVVGGGVHLLDLLELLAEAERDGLLPQVGELAARDLVPVDPARRCGQAGLERRVDPAHRLPVRLHRVDRRERQPGLARGVVGRADQR